MSRNGTLLGLEDLRPARTPVQRAAGESSWAFPVEVKPRWMAGYFGAHILLAVASQRSWVIATVWALSTLFVGFAALSKSRNHDRVAFVAAYVVGAELVWRGTHARVFWEYGKYVLIVLLGLAALRWARGRRDWRALTFLVCLVPSLAVLPYFDREDVAFNLSGPVALGLAVYFFSSIVVTRPLLLRMLVLALGPITGLAFLATFGTLKADPNTFMVGGKATTAGIGPNQVSSILGMGLFFVFVLLVVGPGNRFYRITLGVLGVWLGAQTVLSFSRGGLWAAAGAIVVCAFYVLRDRKSRRILLVTAALGFLITRFVVFPATDRLSHGMVSERFSDSGLTGRERIMKADWIIFLENPLLGVGPGQSYGAHAITFRASSAHTEYTRLLAEHGSFGVVAILMLAWMAWRRWWRPERAPEKGVGLAFMAWALLYMGHSAMRLAAPAFIFGLGTALIVLEGSPVGRRWREIRPVPPQPPVGPVGRVVERRRPSMK